MTVTGTVLQNLPFVLPSNLAQKVAPCIITLRHRALCFLLLQFRFASLPPVASDYCVVLVSLSISSLLLPVSAYQILLSDRHITSYCISAVCDRKLVSVEWKDFLHVHTWNTLIHALGLTVWVPYLCRISFLLFLTQKEMFSEMSKLLLCRYLLNISFWFPVRKKVAKLPV